MDSQLGLMGQIHSMRGPLELCLDIRLATFLRSQVNLYIERGVVLIGIKQEITRRDPHLPQATVTGMPDLKCLVRRPFTAPPTVPQCSACPSSNQGRDNWYQLARDPFPWPLLLVTNQHHWRICAPMRRLDVQRSNQSLRN